MPARTITRILRRNRVPRLHDCDPLTGELIRASKTTAIRYERDRPGELVHVEVKKLGRIPPGGGWKAHGRQMGSTAAKKRAKTGFDFMHSMVDDHTRLAYSEIHNDEKGDTCAGFIERAGEFFARHHDQASDDRQPLELQEQQRRRSCDRQSWGETQVHSTSPPMAERQGRTIQPDPPDRNGLTGRSSRPTTPAQQLCQTSSTATTTSGDTTPSRVTHPSADCHQPDGRAQPHSCSAGSPQSNARYGRCPAFEWSAFPSGSGRDSRNQIRRETFETHPPGGRSLTAHRGGRCPRPYRLGP